MPRTRAELHIVREWANNHTSEARINCEIQEVERGVYRADCVPSEVKPGFTASASSEQAAMLAVLAQLFGVEQDLRDVLVDLEREAWNREGRVSFRTELCAVLDQVDGNHAHDVSESSCDDISIDLLWRLGCVAFNVPFNGCSILQYSGQRFFHIAEWCTHARETFLDSFQPFTLAEADVGRQLRYVAQRTRKLRPIRRPAKWTWKGRRP